MPNMDRVAEVVPPSLDLTTAEREAILEIGYLTIAADRTLRDEEIEAFRSVAERLRTPPHGVDPGGAAAPFGDRELNALLDRFSGASDRTAAEERLRAAATALPREGVRELAYKVAYALAMCDLDTSDEEFEFDLDLIDALDLKREQCERLADEVIHALAGEEPVEEPPT